MNFVKRVVFDTSTLVSAALRPTSIPRQAFLKAIAQAELCVSDSTLAELGEVMSREKFDRYLDREVCMQFVELYRRHARLFHVSEADETMLLTAVDSRTNPASTAGTAQHDLDLVSG